MVGDQAVTGETPIKPEQPMEWNTTLKIAGKPYRCPCGCNVFTKWEENLFECHSCDNLFVTE